jgi:hypothetical protein
MIKRQIALLLLLFMPLELPAQRYGRPDSAQNYGRVQNPPLLLQVKVQKKRTYFRTSDLRKMKRVHLTLSDPTTGQPHTYEGVNLEDLLAPRTLVSESAVIEVSFDKHQTLRIPGANLDADTKPIVVDTIDGRTLTGYVPYYFLARTREEVIVNKNANLIEIK